MVVFVFFKLYNPVYKYIRITGNTDNDICIYSLKIVRKKYLEFKWWDNIAIIPCISAWFYIFHHKNFQIIPNMTFLYALYSEGTLFYTIPYWELEDYIDVKSIFSLSILEIF